jgi:hypothetical protein
MIGHDRFDCRVIKPIDVLFQTLIISTDVLGFINTK